MIAGRLAVMLVGLVILAMVVSSASALAVLRILRLAGSGPAATRYAGRVGDGYITTSGKAPELYTGTLLPAVREGAGKAGRDVTDIDMMIEVKVSFDRDGDAAMHATRFWGALGLTQEQKAGVEDSVEMQRLADDLSGRITDRTGGTYSPDVEIDEVAAAPSS